MTAADYLAQAAQAERLAKSISRREDQDSMLAYAQRLRARADTDETSASGANAFTTSLPE